MPIIVTQILQLVLQENYKMSSTIQIWRLASKSITEIVSKLECAKSAGPDGISAECFKFSDTKIHVLLSLLFSMCLSHGYLPSALIKTTIVPPMVKNKAGDLSDSNNYRPIAIAIYYIKTA